MESIYESCHNLYEVEKIINCKSYKNKKYYLIKWLCYPINESTWEPKSNLKNLKYLIDEFESQYPFSIDQDMYSIFCEEIKKKKRYKKKNNILESFNDKKFLSKKRKTEYFSDSELNDKYLDKLKIHLHINTEKKQIKNRKTSNDNLIIDLSPINFQNESNSTNFCSEELNIINNQENMKSSKLIMPKMA